MLNGSKDHKEETMIKADANLSDKVQRCRISRNKKRYWRKGVEIQDAEDFLSKFTIGDNENVSSWKQNDGSLFTVDGKPNHNNIKLTRRQMAALMKRFKKIEPMDEEKNISKQKLKNTGISRKQVIAKASFSVSTANRDRKPYDLWDIGDQHSQKKGSTVEEHYLLATKKKLPCRPKTLKHVTSILQHVEIAPVGASYNPPVSKYLKYITEAAEEEEKKIKENERLKHRFALLEANYATQKEIELELTAGLNESDDEDSKILEDKSEIGQNDSREKRPTIKQKTKKNRCLEHVERKRKEIENISTFQKEQMHLIYSTRKLNKEISEEIQKQEELAERRKKHKLMKKFAGTQRLGRGKFEPCEKSVLLTEELPCSLRELKPQGNILTERLKSLQKRNMLSIPGEKRRRRKLKNRLRIKEREDRKHQEVKLGTHLI
ncbi:Ribosome biogenesis protein [Dirofilaria immitis]